MLRREIYGNDITGSYDIRLLDHRGGQAMVFYNRASTSLGYQIQVREEYADSVNPPATAADGHRSMCPTATTGITEKGPER